VKSFIVKLVLAAVAVAIAPQTQSVNAQSVNAQPVNTQEAKVGLVAILDVAKVFKENQNFDSQMKAIKAEADRLKVQITQEQEQIKASAQAVTKYEVGSPDRNKLEGDLEQQQAKLRTRARQSETDLLNREARVYYDTYQRMQAIVASVASQNGISLVLRFDSAQIDPGNRGEVIKGVNRAVVYHRQLDLTAMVTEAMNNSAQAKAPATTQSR